jgi:AraC-like DNA-binding protein
MSQAVTYREWAPPRGLEEALSCLWTQVIPEGGAPPVRVLPDACVDVIWQSDVGVYVAGPDTGPAPVAMPPGAVLIGARFRPGAGGSGLGLPLDEIRDRRVDLIDLHAVPARTLPGRLAPDEALRRLIIAVGGMISTRAPDALVTHGARLLSAPGTRCEALGGALDLSERQLRRRFQTAVGYGPKTLQRVLRFRGFLDRVDAGLEGLELADLALELGYADQAHMTREVTRLSGLSPLALSRSRLPEVSPRRPG